MPDSIRIFGELIDNDFAPGFDHLDLAAAFHLDAGGAAVLDHYLAGETPDQRQVRPLQRRLEIGVGDGPAAAFPDRLLHGAETLLLFAIIVVSQLEPGLLAGLDESLEQRIVALATRDMKGPRPAPAVRIAAMRAWMPVFHALEVGNYVGIPPAGGTAFGPVVVVASMAANIDHAVD
jgi:hypothetical protein